MISKYVTIVVPAYNTRQWLECCIHSILAQTYTNFEVLLIDDGSTDGTGDLCDQFALSDPRIKVIHKKNGGLSDARNTGLRAASGEYITFVDSDDWIHPQMLQTLLYGIEKENADLSMGFIQNMDSFSIPTNELDETAYSVRNREEYWHLGYEKAPIGRQFTMCPAKLYRISFLTGLSFLEGVTHEDVFWSADYAQKVQKAIIYSVPVYFYYQRPGSIMHTTKPKEVRDQLNACLYKLKICVSKFPDQAQEGRIKFLEFFFVTANRSLELAKEDRSIVRCWLLKNRREVVRCLRPALTSGQKCTLLFLPVLPNFIFLKLLDYRLDISAYFKKHFQKREEIV